MIRLSLHMKSKFIPISCKPSELMTIYEGADNEKTREKMRFIANNRYYLPFH